MPGPSLTRFLKTYSAPAALLICLFSAALNINAQEIQISLTEQERLWLDAHPVIRVVQDPGWAPIEFTDSTGEPAGMSNDYLSLIEKRLGITFTLSPVESWQEAYSGLKSRDFDMTTSVTVTPERLEFLKFTRPYMTIPIVIITAAELTYISSMKELGNKPIAVVENYAVNDLILRDFPNIDLVVVKNSIEGLEMLENKKVFGFVENMLVAGYYMSQLKLNGIKVAGETPYKNAQSMAVRNDWPILADILQKALDSITERERDEIYFKWVPIRYEHGLDYSLLWRSIAISAVIVLLLTGWIYRLQREIKQRKQAELDRNESEYQLRFHLNNTPIGVIEWDLNLTVKEWNPAAEKIFGYKKEEIAGSKNGLCIVPDSRKEEVESILKYLCSTDNSSEKYRHSINKNITKSGKLITCEWFNTSITSSDGAIIGIAALCQDVTTQVEAQQQLKSSLSEKEILLKELHHRTKNNMQMISAFLRLESQLYSNADVEKLVDSVDSRIQTMALVHERIFQSRDLSKLNIHDYINDIVSLISSYHQSRDQQILIKSNIENFEVSIDDAIPLGLVINEIVTNTYKHAFPDNQNGILSIHLHRTDEDIIVLDISDNGVGFTDQHEKNPSTFGILTITSIIEMQLQGKIEISSDNGVSYHITMNASGKLERV